MALTDPMHSFVHLTFFWLHTLLHREGDRVTYDMWRKAIMSNSGVKMLKGLQFGMLDEDNDGEVSLSDISRAVFRRAGDRDRSRIRKFLEVQSW